jgi:hypothetical protein
MWCKVRRCEGENLDMRKREIAIYFVVVVCGVAAWANPPAADGFDANDFAAEVIEYIQGSGVGFDCLSFDTYNNPQTALGRPTLETTGDGWYIPESISMPVVPVYPPFRAFEIVTIGNGGKLILKFNHKVSDDENNPYDIDFIIFGNSLWGIASGGPWGPDSNPEMVTVGTFCKERGIVSVSQDGQNWYTFTTGPYADDFAPTASYEWDDVNDVWGRELNPTRPVDPNLTPANFNGKSVAEIIGIYNGSAGGTGFDIGALGLDWIQYVRIEDDPGGGSGVTTEIDAIADVSCCGDYKHPIVAGDINRDCRVDYEDLEILCDYWLAEINDPQEPAKAADIYEDDVVNLYDMALLAGNWLYCNWECE